MPITLDPFSITTGYELLKIAKREGVFSLVIDSVRPKNRVLLLGSTGAGKSQFCKSIPELISRPISQASRTISSRSDRFEINGKLFEFTDTPGQPEHKPIRTKATKNAIKKKFKGIINCVSFGYHEYGAPSREVLIGDEVLPSYLEEHRGRELALIGEWASLLDAEWVLTLITKADLWWDAREEIHAYYERGEYNQELRKFFPDAHTFVRPYASIISKFYGVVPVSGYFDDNIRLAARQEVFRVLREAVDSSPSRTAHAA